MSQKTVFISYRRDATGKLFARSLEQALKQRGYDVFLDVDCIASGKWEQQILTQVSSRAHFVLVLSQNALDRCAEANDWLRREYELAVRCTRNIVPIWDGSVDVAHAREACPECMKGLFDLQIAGVRHESFEADIDTLVNRYIPADTTPLEEGGNCKTTARKQNEDDALSELAQLCNEAVEVTLSYGWGPTPEEWSERSNYWDRIRLAGSRIYFQKEIQQLARDLVNALQRHCRDRREYADDGETRADCDRILKSITSKCMEMMNSQ